MVSIQKIIFGKKYIEKHAISNYFVTLFCVTGIIFVVNSQYPLIDYPGILVPLEKRKRKKNGFPIPRA